MNENDSGFDPSIELLPIDGPGSPPRSHRKVMLYLLIA